MKLIKMLLAGTAFVSVGSTADAAVLMDVSQVGANVVVTVSGTFDRALATATGSYAAGSSGFVRGTPSRLILSSTGSGRGFALTSKETIGTGTTQTTVSSSTGIIVGLYDNDFVIISNYVSNSQITVNAHTAIINWETNAPQQGTTPVEFLGSNGLVNFQENPQ
ncbi:MAG: hypothetical protein EOO77_37650, partial [Oxalobacteraceae bacterium]